MKKVLFVCVLLLLYVSGCSNSENTTKKESWSVSPTFTLKDKITYGEEGIFAITRENGEENEPDFPADQGRLYSLHFLDSNKDVVGKEMKISAISKEDKTTTVIWEGKIEGKEMGAKLAVGKAGVYKIVVKVEDKVYSNFVIEVRPSN